MQYILVHAEVEIENDKTVAPTWVKCNSEQKGYYRVKYSKDLWGTIMDVIKSNHKDLTPADFTNLIDDAFVLTR